MHYSCQVCETNTKSTFWYLTKNELKILNCQQINVIFYVMTWKFLKIQIIVLTVCLCLIKLTKAKSLPQVIGEYFKAVGNQHRHNTRGAINMWLNVPRVNSVQYGSNSVMMHSVLDWNTTVIDLIIEVIIKHQNVQALKMQLKVIL